MKRLFRKLIGTVKKRKKRGEKIIFAIFINVIKMKTKAVTVNKDILGGTPVFTGTRVPVQTLFDYLEGAYSIDDFLKSFPTVKKKLVVEVLHKAEKLVVLDESIA